jgi:uncharacterized protein (DUF488 family)
VGHSTRTLDNLARLLKAYGIQRLVDVRSIPRSRHNPQFNRVTLSRFLRNRRINYRHMKSLGGLRHERTNSPNTGWRNASFRGFADYMQTPDFAKALGQLIKLAVDRPTAIMCAEAVPWRCHRSLIADALTVQGLKVKDIFSATNVKPHILTPLAKLRGTQVTYPG